MIFVLLELSKSQICTFFASQASIILSGKINPIWGVQKTLSTNDDTDNIVIEKLK